MRQYVLSALSYQKRREIQKIEGEKMNYEEAKKEVKRRLEEYLRARGIDTRHKFKCLNPQHADEHPSMSYDPKRQIVHCFSCGVSYDTLKIMEIETGMRGYELFKHAYEYFGIQVEGNSPERAYKPQEASMSGQGISKYLKECEGALKGSEGEKYLHERGFNDKILKECHVGYDESKKSIVLPYIRENDYYITRSIEGKEYRKPKGKSEPLYQLGEKSSIVYVTEGQIDAMSLYQSGVQYVVAIGGGGTEKLKNIYDKKIDMLKRAVIVRDNDEAGKATSQRIKEMLNKVGIVSVVVAPPEEYKDSNEILAKNEERLKYLVGEWEEEASELPIKAPRNMEKYLMEGLKVDLKRFQRYKDRKTGFSNLDEETSLYPGLYVLGAISSLGKTTFAHQMADQLSANGNRVLYFSLEQNQLEIASKGLSRLMARINATKAVSAIQIRRGYWSEELEEAIEKYKEIGRNEEVIECDFDTTIADIVEYVEQYIETEGESPVVMIDYLQVIRPEGTRPLRESIDANVKALKKLQSENDIVVMVISSLNRLNYMSSVDFESFKESGGIEYTADVVWGLQLKEITKDGFERKSINDKREAIRQAKLANPRELELVCLKNRYGRSSYKCGFKYYAQYDLFVPENEYFEEPRSPEIPY